MQKIKQLQTQLKSGCLLVTSPSDLFYLTGQNPDGCWLLVFKNKVVVFASEMISSQAKKLLRGFKIETAKTLSEAFAVFCKANRVKRVNCDISALSHLLYKKLEKTVKIKDCNALSCQRLVKHKDEIKLIEKSCIIAKNAVKWVKPFIKVGKTEKQIAFKIEEYFAKCNVKPSFPTIVASGPNSAFPHHIPSDRKIGKNDTILIDIGCIYKGYCSDLTRTFFLGKISELKKRVYEAVRLAHQEALKGLKSGIQAKSADSYARRVISSFGYGKNFIHSTGHGVGVDIHEAPRLSEKDNTVIKEGMVVTVEPGVYLPGKFGVRIEDTVIITKNGYKGLTQ